MSLIKEFIADKMNVKVFSDRTSLGKASAIYVASLMKKIADEKNDVRMIFAAAPSQNEFLSELTKMNLPWNKVTAFHMDEYIGLPKNSAQSFSSYLKENLFNKVEVKEVNYISSNVEDIQDEMKNYINLLLKTPIDIVCMGVGENGHIAFNDPPVADFNDEKIMKIVELDDRCRQQQINDGCFDKIENVPSKAVTLTVPTLMSGKYLSVVVPGKTKADVISKTLKNDITTSIPSTILRKHNSAILFLDRDAFSKYES